MALAEKTVFRKTKTVPKPTDKWFEDREADCFKVDYGVRWQGRLIQVRRGAIMTTPYYQEAKAVAKAEDGEVVEWVTWYYKADVAA